MFVPIHGNIITAMPSCDIIALPSVCYYSKPRLPTVGLGLIYKQMKLCMDCSREVPSRTNSCGMLWKDSNIEFILADFGWLRYASFETRIQKVMNSWFLSETGWHCVSINGDNVKQYPGIKVVSCLGCFGTLVHQGSKVAPKCSVSQPAFMWLFFHQLPSGKLT